MRSSRTLLGAVLQVRDEALETQGTGSDDNSIRLSPTVRPIPRITLTRAMRHAYRCERTL
jgi:hypothetical protein